MRFSMDMALALLRLDMIIVADTLRIEHLFPYYMQNIRSVQRQNYSCGSAAY